MTPAKRIFDMIELYQAQGNTEYLREAKAIALCLHEQVCAAYEAAEITHKSEIGKTTLELV